MAVTVISRRLRPKQDPNGGGGGSASPLDSPSTTVYVPESVPADLEVTLPTTFLDTRYDQGGVALTWASDITLTDTGNVTTNATNLQNAMNDSLTRSGHSRINLPDGFVAEGVFKAGIKTQGNYWTYVQRENRGTEGTRCTAAQMASAPILRTTTTNRAVIETLASANYWRFDELKLETTAAVTTVVVYVGPLDTNGNTTGSSVTDLPNYIYFHRCWVPGRSGGNIRVGVRMNCRAGAFVDGIIEQIYETGSESKALLGDNTFGPLKIVNNKLEAGSITVLFGGSDPYTNCVVTDMEFRRNWLTVRDSWNPFHATFDSVSRGPKNRLEFKCGVRCLVEGNVIEKSPLGGQNGEAFVVKSMASEAGLNAAWFITKDIYCRYNIGRELWNWLYCVGVQMPHLETLGGTDRIAFSHNLIHDYADTRYSNSSYSFGMFFGDATNVQVHHMTVVPRAASFTTLNPAACWWTADMGAGDAPGLRFYNSILHSGHYESNRWVFTNNGPDGEAELNRITGSDYTLQNCMVIEGNASAFPSGEVLTPANIAAVNFSSDDPSIGLDGDSPAKNAATDGTDMGCNYTKVNLATSGVV
jgi:hypothetical protein